MTTVEVLKVRHKESHKYIVGVEDTGYELGDVLYYNIPVYPLRPEIISKRQPLRTDLGHSNTMTFA